MLVSQTQDVQVLAMRCPPGLWTGQSSTEGFSQTWIAPRSSLSACTGSKVRGVVCLLGKWHGDALRDTFKGTQQTDGALLPSHRAHANAIWFIWFSLSQYGRTRLNTFLWAAFFPLFEQIHWLLEDWVDQVPIEVKKEDVIVWAVIELLSVDRMVFCMSCVIPFLTISISKLILQWTTGFKTTSLHSCIMYYIIFSCSWRVLSWNSNTDIRQSQSQLHNTGTLQWHLLRLKIHSSLLVCHIEVKEVLSNGEIVFMSSKFLDHSSTKQSLQYFVMTTG